ncbi:MAG: hypothetical protein IJG63_07900 [Oscillospiraceae bacterium]|nr:hypothetical protein [Oscillospiraceae bacterium]
MKKRCNEEQVKPENSVGMSEEELLEVRQKARKSVIRYALLMLLAVLAVIILSYFITQRNINHATAAVEQAARFIPDTVLSCKWI